LRPAISLNPDANVLPQTADNCSIEVLEVRFAETLSGPIILFLIDLWARISRLIRFAVLSAIYDRARCDGVRSLSFYSLISGSYSALGGGQGFPESGLRDCHAKSASR
jgi:hypothetical protein